MAQAFRFSTIPGSDNTAAMPKRQNIALGSVAAGAVDLLGVSDGSEFTLVTLTPTGTVVLAFSSTEAFYVGDRLTVLCVDTATNGVQFGEGFRNSGSSPEVPDGMGMVDEGVFEFIFDGDKFMLANFIIF